MGVFLGNPQTSVCFRAAWKKGEDPNDIRTVVKKLWPIEVTDIDLVQGTMSKYMKDKKAAIIVNVASNWPFAKKNYLALFEMHKKYSDRGFQIIAFPCNQFNN